MDELRLGLAGIDGSHCVEFSRIINGNGRLGARVLFFLDRGQSEKERKNAAILMDLGAQPVRSLDEMTPRIDAALVTCYNHVKDNYPSARSFLERGIPVYVDKVLSSSIPEARHLVTMAEAKKLTLHSDSALRWVREVKDFSLRRDQTGIISSGVVAGAGDLTRYGHHTIRMMQGVFGSGIDWVNDCRDPEKDAAMVCYRDGRTVALFLHRAQVKRGWRFIYFGESEVGHVEIATDNIYANLVEEIIAVLKGERPAPPSVELLEVVATVEALRTSALTGTRVSVRALLADDGFDP